MGHNVNLVKMLGLPEEVECPNCGQKIATNFDDYDIEGGEPNPSPGKWKLHLYCGECDDNERECEFKFVVEVSLSEPIFEEY